jgi:hypothetical protein
MCDFYGNVIECMPEYVTWSFNSWKCSLNKKGWSNNLCFLNKENALPDGSIK